MCQSSSFEADALLRYGELIAKLDDSDNEDCKHGRHKEHVHGESPKLEVKIRRTGTGPENGT
jgi:hypothetical protein